MRLRGCNALVGAAFVAALLRPGVASFAAESTGDAPNCAVSAALTRLGAPLNRTAGLIAEDRSLTILAMGSSSTQGVGASSLALSYPSRLDGELRKAFPAPEIAVVNHGRGGQDVGQEFARLNRDVVDGHPDLVIWQVGTNALLRRENLSVEEQLISKGVELMKQHGIDVVLMDMQYAPRVLARRNWDDMERLIAAVARREQVGYFRRFDIMREWYQSGQLAPAAVIGPDGLHMTDVSYGCLADRLAQSLAEQWRAQGKLAKSPNRNPAVFAGSERTFGKMAH
jgi:acyl-CoA thioesterase I